MRPVSNRDNTGKNTIQFVMNPVLHIYIHTQIYFPPTASFSLSVSLPEYAFSVGICLFESACKCGFSLYLCLKRQQTEAVGGKRYTSMRVNAICEFRCLIDPSGPQSLFSISIYHNRSALDHINVSPSCLTYSLPLRSQAFAHSVDPPSHSPTWWFWVSTEKKKVLNELPQSIKRV